MQSAYQRLGVPEDATSVDIEIAFMRATERHAREVSRHGLAVQDDYDAMRTAYNILREPESREAHDRFLREEVPDVRMDHDHHAPLRRRTLLWGGAFAAAMTIAASAYYTDAVHAKERAAQAEAELARARLAQQLADKRREEDVARAERARQEAEDRRFALESQAMADRAKREREQREQDAEMARKAEACYRVYRRYDC